MEQLCGVQIILRPLTALLIPHYLAAFTQEVCDLLHINDVQSEETYLVQRLALMRNRRTFFYCIFDKMQHLIGAIEIRGQENSGQLYTWLHPDSWGKQYFQEAVKLAQEAYFKATKSLYFTARVDITNKRSYRALKNAGFADYSLVEGPYGQQYELVCIKKAS